MAPSPVFHEPKGPDKSCEKGPEDIFRRDKQIMPNDSTDSHSKDKSNAESINIHDIGEGELKSLLDEAYNFRSPKDREGKSILFQKLLNDVEESDVGKKKKIDHNRVLVDGAKATTSAAIDSGHHHDSAGGDQSFLNNILGGCERDKKKKKSGKRECSNSNGGGSSRRPKFSHQLKINSGSQSSVYNGNVGSGNGTNVSTNNISTSNNHSSTNLFSASNGSTSRGSPRGKPTTLLTSSSNIDIPMVTTYNKQPTQCIMTPAVAPRKQQRTELQLLQSSSGDESGKNEEIELKPLNEIQRGSHFTTRASLEIDGDVSKQQQQCDVKDDAHGYALSTDDCLVSCSTKAIFFLQSKNTLVNGNADLSSLNASRFRSSNGILDSKEDGSSSDTTGSYLHAPKESLEQPRRSGDEGTNYQLKDRDGSTRRLKKRKEKKDVGHNFMSDSVAGHCGDQSLEYLLTYIEKNRRAASRYAAQSHSMNGAATSNPRSPRARPPASNGAGVGGGAGRVKASTDEDVRHKKLAVGVTKEKEFLKKSTSLEDLRRCSSGGRSKSNKKQSSVDDCHYGEPKAKSKSSSPIPATPLPPVARRADAPSPPSIEPPAAAASNASTETSHLYYDSPLEDNYKDEFHLVTKKQRRKKRRSTSRATDQKSVAAGGRTSVSHGGFLPHNYTDRGAHHEGGGGGGGGGGGFKRSTRSTENRHRSRRKSVSSSVVPCDKISDSDSIHSLPVSSTTPKCRIKKKSTSSGCTPQASYADIAKSPQCHGSMMTLDGDSTTATKWQATKTFSNISSSLSSSATMNAAGSADAASNTTVDSTDHSDHAELVSSSTQYEERVELDDDVCDQLSLSNNPSSNSCSGTDSPTAAARNDCNNARADTHVRNDIMSDSNVNDSASCKDEAKDDTNARCGDSPSNKAAAVVDSADSTTTPNNSNNNNNNVSTIVNSYSQVCFNGKIDKSKDGLNPSTDADYMNGNLNHSSCSDDNNNAGSASKRKTSKGPKKTSTSEKPAAKCAAAAAQADDATPDKTNQRDLFIEVTLSAPSMKTKCSQTQTDLMEVNNNAYGHEVTVEETVIVKNNRVIGSSAAHGRKLSATVERVLTLPADESTCRKSITVEFNVDGEVLEQATAVSGDQRRADVLKEITERGSKYNVREVIQYVNESWNEVLNSSSSATIKYYSA